MPAEYEAGGIRGRYTGRSIAREFYFDLDRYFWILLKITHCEIVDSDGRRLLDRRLNVRDPIRSLKLIRKQGLIRPRVGPAHGSKIINGNRFAPRFRNRRDWPSTSKSPAPLFGRT